MLSRVQLFATPWTAARQASLSITNSWSPPKPMSIESVMPSNHLILCRPLLLLPSIFPSIRVFSNESALHIRWPKYWNFSFSISPSNEYSGLISFRIDWLDLLVAQGTLKSLLQHSSKASILQHSAFFIVQLSQETVRVTRVVLPWLYYLFKVQSLSCVRHFATPWIAARQAFLSITNSGVHPNSCASSQWCHLAISSSVIAFSSCPQSLPASGPFPLSQPFTWGGQSIGVSASASALPMNTQDGSPLGWTGWIFLQSRGLTRFFSSITVQKHQIFGIQLSSQSNSHKRQWELRELYSLDYIIYLKFSHSVVSDTLRPRE